MYKINRSLWLFCGIILIYFLININHILCIKNNSKKKNTNLLLDTNQNDDIQKNPEKKKMIEEPKAIISNSEMKAKEIDEENEINPWKPYMRKFNIYMNHKSGVRVDLKGFAKGKSVDQYNAGPIYRYPAGQCPVFSKIIKIKNNNNFLNKVFINEINTNIFLKNMLSGDVPTLFHINENSGLQFPNITNKNNILDLYNTWVSPINTKTIIECAKYADKFEHNIEYIKNNYNCINSSGKCLKQPFVYDLFRNKCYILYPVMQEKKNIYEYDYWPEKSNMHKNLVYGSSNIQKNWLDNCVTKPVKGVAFGVWENNKCKRLSGGRKIMNATADTCGIKLFDESPSDNINEKNKEKIKEQLKLFNKTSPGRILNPSSFVYASSKGLGYNWANYDYINGCEIYDTPPSCFIHTDNDINAYAYTSTAMADTYIYDIPPCFNYTDKWTVEANCIDGKLRMYTCTNGLWQSDDNHQINKCESNYTWANFIPDIEQKEKDEAKEKEELTVPEKEEVEKIPEEIEEEKIKKREEKENVTKQEEETEKKIKKKEKEESVTKQEEEEIEEESVGEKDEEQLEDEEEEIIEQIEAAEEEEKKKEEDELCKKRLQEKLDQENARLKDEQPHEPDNSIAWKIAGGVIGGIALFGVTVGVATYVYKTKTADAKKTEGISLTLAEKEQFIMAGSQSSVWIQDNAFNDETT